MKRVMDPSLNQLKALSRLKADSNTHHYFRGLLNETLIRLNKDLMSLSEPIDIFRAQGSIQVIRELQEHLEKSEESVRSKITMKI